MWLGVAAWVRVRDLVRVGRRGRKWSAGFELDCAHAHMHVCIQERTYTDTHVDVHADVHADALARTFTHTYTYT